jgi:hypothetical protein
VCNSFLTVFENSNFHFYHMSFSKLGDLVIQLNVCTVCVHVYVMYVIYVYVVCVCVRARVHAYLWTLSLSVDWNQPNL